MSELLSGAKQLQWDAGKDKSAQAHQASCITITDRGFSPQLQNRLENDLPRLEDGLKYQGHWVT